MPYTPQQQAEINARVPGIEWINGEPYTRESVTPPAASYAADGTPLDYLGQPIQPTGETRLVPASTRPDRFPWELIAMQVAAPALVAGGGALLGGGAAAGGAAPAAAYGGLPLTSAMPAGLTAAGISAPAAVGGGTAAGGGGLWSTILGGGNSRTAAALDVGGRLLGGVTAGMTANRTQQDAQNLQRDQLALQRAGAETGNEVNRAQLQIQQQEAAQREQADAYRKVLMGQLAQNVQDVTIDRSQFQSDVPTISFSGGLRPSAIGEAGRAAGGVLSQQASDRLQNPTTPEPLPTYNAPAMSAPSKASMWEQILSPLATGAVAAGNWNRVQPTTAAPPAQRVG